MFHHQVKSAIEESTFRLAAYLKTHCAGSEEVPLVKVLQGVPNMTKPIPRRKTAPTHMTESWRTGKEAFDNFIDDIKGPKSNCALKSILASKFEFLQNIDETWPLDHHMLSQMGCGETGKEFLLLRLTDGLPTSALNKTPSQVQTYIFVELF